MALHRGIDGSEPLRPEPITRLGGPVEERRSTRVWRLGHGTLACPDCDAPVAPEGAVAPSDPLRCPFCGTAGHVRDFLSLGEPTRPARVEVRLRVAPPAAPGRARRRAAP